MHQSWAFDKCFRNIGITSPWGWTLAEKFPCYRERKGNIMNTTPSDNETGLEPDLDGAAEPLGGSRAMQQADTQTVIDVTTASFMNDVIEASKSQLVLLDLWAPWCGPCKQLTPVLEKIVQESNGAVRLAKMNIDEEPAVAQQLQVQSIPAVFAFKDGQPVDGFSGAIPESQIREFIEKSMGETLGPSPEEQLLEHAQAAFAEQNFGGAAQSYAQILQNNPDHLVAIGGLSECFTAVGQLDQAEQALAQVPGMKRDSAPILAAQAALDLARQAETASGDFAELEAAIVADPNNHQARFDLALAYQAAQRNQDAVDALLEIITLNRDWDEGAARKQLVTLFQAFGNEDPITVEGRRRLSSLLFS
jgi:putative thioredoxin